jgi:hypothetical protein
MDEIQVEIPNNGWNQEVEDILERLRVNSVSLSEYHRRNFYDYKSYAKYFRIPIIIMSIINSTAAVGLVNVGVEQVIVNGICCLIGMLISIISAVELYLNIEKAMDSEMQQSKDFYTLAIDIFRMLKLKREDRGENGKEFMNKKYALYTKLRETADLMRKKVKHDTLAKVPFNLETPSPGSSDLEEDPYKVFPQSTSYIFDRFIRKSQDKV